MASVGAVWIDVLPSMKNFGRTLKRDVRGAATAAGTDYGQQFSRAAQREADRAGRTFGQRFGRAVDKAVTASLRGVSKTALPLLISSVGASAVSLTAALAPATGAILALPAAAGVAAGGLATLAAGVHGVGDAMAAVAEGDAEKLTEAMENLSPKAREFVRSWGGITEAFAPIRRAVQDQLFSGLASQIDALAEGGMPVLETGMTQVATSLNGLAREAVATAQTPLFQGQLSDIFEGTAAATDAFAGTVEPLMTVLAELVKIGLPLVTRFAQWAEGGLESAAAFLASEEGAQRMSDMVDRAVDTLNQLWSIGTNLGTALSNIFGATSQDGSSLLDTIEDLTNRFAEWTGSAEGQEQLATTFGMLNQIFTDLVAIMPTVASILGTVSDTVQELPGPVQDVVTQTAAWSILLAPLLGRITSLAPAVGLLAKGIGGLGKGIGGAAKWAFGKGGFFSRLAQGFKDVRVAQSAFSGRAGSLGGVLRKAWDGALNATKRGASAVAGAARSAWSGIQSAASAAASGIRSGANAAASAARAGFDRLKAGAASAAAATRSAGQAALATARQWGSLAAQQTRAAVAATRARIATIAAAAAQRTAAAAARVWAVAQRLLNAVLRANPIGLIITAVTLLIGALIYAYNNVDWFRNAVDTAFRAIGDAAMWVWDNALKPAFDAITNVIMTYVVPAVLWLWNNVLVPAFQGIASIVSWAWNNVIKPIFSLYVSYIQTVIIPIVLWLWNNVISPAFKGISSAISWAWNNIIKPAFAAIVGFVKGTLAPIFQWLYLRVIQPVWNGIKTAISLAWSGIKVVFNWLKDGVSAVKVGFETARDGIEKAWNKLKSITRKPVEFVINTVYNKGIVPVWNKVAKLVGMDELKKLEVKFAAGGIMPGYTPGRDIHHFFSPTAGFLSLSGGETIFRPEFTRAVGSRFVDFINRVARTRGVAGVRAALGFARGGIYPAQSFANGGIVGQLEEFGKSLTSIVDGDALKSAAKKILDPLVESMREEFGGAGRWAKAMISLPETISRKMLNWFRDAIGPKLGGDGKKVFETAKKYVGLGGNPNRFTRAFGMPGQPWCAMFVSEMIKEAKAQEAYNNIRSAAVSSFANSSLQSIYRMADARPGDLAVYRGRGPGGWGHINIYGGDGVTIGGNESNSVKRSTTYASRATKFMRPRKMKSGGIWWQDTEFNTTRTTPAFTELLRALDADARVYDRGGWLQPGLSMVYNGTRAPEAVLTDRQWRTLTAAARQQRSGHQITVIGASEPRRTADRLVTALRDYEVLHP